MIGYSTVNDRIEYNIGHILYMYTSTYITTYISTGFFALVTSLFDPENSYAIDVINSVQAIQCIQYTTQYPTAEYTEAAPHIVVTPPLQDGSGRRKTQEVITKNVRSPYAKARQICEIIGVSVLPFLCLHFILVRIGQKYSLFYAQYTKGILGIPGLYFLACIILSNPFTVAAAGLCSLDTGYGYLGCIGMMIALPLPLIALSFYIVYTYVIGGKTEYVPYNHRTVGSVITLNSYGRWQPQNVCHRLGVFFEHIRGPNEKRSALVNAVRVYHVPMKLVKNCAIVFTSSCIARGTLQSGLLLVYSTVYLIIIYSTNPLNGFRQQLSESLLNICETVGYGALLQIARTPVDRHYYISMMSGSQKAQTAIIVATQVWAFGFLFWHILLAKIKQFQASKSGKKVAVNVSKQDAANNIKTQAVEEGDTLTSIDTGGDTGDIGGDTGDIGGGDTGGGDTGGVGGGGDLFS